MKQLQNYQGNKTNKYSRLTGTLPYRNDKEKKLGLEKRRHMYLSSLRILLLFPAKTIDQFYYHPAMMGLW